MEIALYIISGICVLIGLAGCIVPVLPGIPISFVGLVLLHFTDKVEFSHTELGVFLVLTIVTQIASYYFPIWFTKKFGGTKWGIRGSTIGLFIGLFGGPIGIILGPMIGAFVGELLFNKDVKIALKSGVGSFIGFICNTGLSLIVAGYFIWKWVVEMFFK